MTLTATGGADQPQTGVGVIDRVVRILDAVEHGATSHAAIVRATGLSRTTTYRLLKALEAHGFLTYVGGRGYRLGAHLLRLAASSLHEIPLRALARPALDRLAAVTGESAQLWVATVDGRVCVEAVASSRELRAIVEVGVEFPVTAGSAGKIFMAWSVDGGEELVRRAERLTPDTPTGDRLRRQVHAARQQGWSSSAGERAVGVGSVSAPVLGPLGELVAVVSMSGPTSRVTRIGAKRYAPAVVEAAREIERAMGYQA